MSEPGEEEILDVPPPPPSIQHAELKRQYQLPVKAEKFSFGLAFTPPEGTTLDIDLSCVLFDSNGAVMDCAYHQNFSALNGAVRHNGDNQTGCAAGDSEVIHVYPGLVPEDCCLMMFTTSGAGLGSCSAMALTAYAKEAKKAKEAVVVGDLLSGDGLADAACQVTLAVYRSANGWIAYYTFAAAPPGQADWGAAVPCMKVIASQIPSLEAASHFAADPADAVTLPPKSADRAINVARAFDPTAKAPAPPRAVSSWPETPAGDAPAPPPRRLRLDVGWALWSAEPEGVDMQFQVVFTAANGEVVECGEDQGVTQGIQGPPEEEEEEPAEEGEEAAAVDVVHPVPKGQDVDQHGFPVKESFYIQLEQLPSKVKNITVQVSNMAGAGMKETKTLCVRAVDASAEDPVSHKDLFVFCTSNGHGQNGDKTVAVLAKLYRETAGTAFAQLRDGACQPLSSCVDDAERIRTVLTAVRDEHCGVLEIEKQLAAALEAEEAGEEDVVKPVLPASEWRICGLGLLDKADDLESYAEEAKRCACYEGTYNAAGRRESACARVVYDNKDMFMGQYVDDRRHGKGIYVFANKGAYAGEYENGLRHGRGVMIMPDGGWYSGEFQADRFHGQGTYEYPDKSCYVGAWENSKKHGAGTYWDKHGGCISGSWQAGVLTGASSYHQPAYSLDARYTKGIPDGECRFTCAAFRKNKEREIACAHITTDAGPVLTQTGYYAIPEGAAADPQLDGDGNPIEDDSKPKMPSFPKYDGLTFVASHASAAPGSNMVYPPELVTPPSCVSVPAFTMAAGLTPIAS